MTADDVTPEDQAAVDRFTIYGAYGEIMHKFQVLELVLWGFQSRSIKSGTTVDQAMERISRWDSTTLGSMWRGMRTQDHWPDGMVDEVDHAVLRRNFLAHHFLRECFVVKPSPEHHQRVLTELAAIHARLDRIMGDMETHSRACGIADLEDLDKEAREEIEAFRPTTWFSNWTDEEQP